ncbi:MAG: chromate transporter [Ruminococcaceae bacterium]|nr:chromate transporter [Oscillospiraceae bacterium]
MAKAKDIVSLFVQFLKFGFFTFGGGWSIVAQMRRVYVVEKGCLSDEELLDLTSVGRSLPGIMIGNVAMLFGYRQAGVLGGIACVLGLTLPPMAVLSVITLFYTAFRDSKPVAAAMNGIRAAVIPIILSAALPLIKGNVNSAFGVVLVLLGFALYLFAGMNCVWIVLIGAVCGVLYRLYAVKRGDRR